jgi:NADP-dependent 3-hydroxy acid dehydrogenase YdfG
LTGASRGFGAAIAVDLAKQSLKTKNSITFILVARSLEGLERTKSSVKETYPSAIGL